MRRRRRAGALAMFGLLALGGVVAGAAPASAHAGLESSDPADGVTLDAPPDRILLTFSQPPDLSLSSFGLLDATGAALDLREPVAEGEGGRQVALTPVEALGDGVFTVTFRVVSQTDGHLTAGTIAFGVGAVTGDVVPTASAPTGEPGPSLLSVVGKGLLYVGLVVLVGAAAVGLLAFDGQVPGRRRLLPLAGLTALVGSLVMLVAEARAVGAGLSTVARSPAGEPFLWLIGATIVVAAVSAIAGGRSSRGWLIAAGLVAGLAMLVRATGGHAGGRPVEEGLQWIHFLGVGVWVGGFALLLLLLRTRRGGPSPVPEARRYSRLAGYALLVVVATGVLRAIDELDGLAGVAKAFDTPYGTTLAIKVAVVVLLIGLGALNRTKGIPRLGQGSSLLPRLLGIEIVTAVAIFGLTATLTGLPPHPQEAPAAPSGAMPAGVSVEGSDFATTVHVMLDVLPGTPGPNTYELHVVDFDSGEMVPADAVRLRFDPIGRPAVGPSGTDLSLDDEGHWVGDGTQLSVPGPWTITALITTGASSTEVPMSVSIEPAGQEVHVTSEAGQPTIVTFVAADGRELQYYADPGVAGANQLHLTAFDAAGRELPLADATIVVTPEGGPPEIAELTRFSPGHVVANLTLDPGSWHVDLLATAKDGGTLTGAFDQTIDQE